MRQTKAQAALAIAIAASVASFGAGQPRPQQSVIDANSAPSKLSFDVTSVKKVNTSGSALPGLGAVQINGGSFSMLNISVETLLHFAYDFAPDEKPLGLPSSMTSERFDVEARASGNPTREGFRTMTRSLLADRFKLAAHYETRQTPIYGLMQAKPGKLGPQLRTYSDAEEPCVAKPTPKQTVAGGFPASCGQWQFLPDHAGVIRVGGRNMGMEDINNVFQIFAHLDRRVFDQSGLSGKYDFILEWGFTTSDAPTAETNEPTFSEALQAQLGLKLEAKTAPVNILVVDHIEEPAPN